MATPHVAGVMAMIMSYEGYSKLSAQDVYDRLNVNAIKEVVLDDGLLSAGVTTNLLQSGLVPNWEPQIDPYKLPVAASNLAEPANSPNVDSTTTVVIIGTLRIQPELGMN